MIARIVAPLLDRHAIPKPLRLDRLLRAIRTRHISAKRSRPGRRHVSTLLVRIDGVVGGEFDVLHSVVGAQTRLAAAGQDVEG